MDAERDEVIRTTWRESVRLYIEAVGCRLVFLPAYSPDFALIEQAFSTFKGCLRGIGARTQEALDAAIAQALRAITATDAMVGSITAAMTSKEANLFANSSKSRSSGTGHAQVGGVTAEKQVDTPPE